MAKRRIPSKLRALVLGDTLRDLRRERGLTRREVADGLGWSVAFYRELEQGRVKRNDPRWRAIRVQLRFTRP
jgi:transcriptional regulator with XRE-family HTH domain